MQEYKIIKTLESLKKVKPSKDWANFAKQDILSKSFEPERLSVAEGISLVLKFVFSQPKMAIASSFVICFVALTFIVSTNIYNATPQAATNSAKVLTPEEKLLAAIRSTDLELSKIPTISSINGELNIVEVKKEAKRVLASASEQLKDLPEKQKAVFAGTVVARVKALEKNANTVIMDEDKTAIQEFYKIVAEDQIKEIESNTKNLTDNQKAILSKAKDFFAVSKYGEALEELYKIQPAPSIPDANPNKDSKINSDNSKEQGIENKDGPVTSIPEK